MTTPVRRSTAALRGRRILVLNWRDVRHPQAGGAEAYAHEIARRWVAAGARVTWLTAREGRAPRSETIDGVRVLRAGGALGVYLRTAARLVRVRGADAVVDCQNGVPFFSPLFLAPAVPVVQLVHHVHQDQFATRFSRAGAALGRLLEGRVARRVYAGRLSVAVSVSTRQEMRRRLGFRDPVAVVPNGTAPAGPRGSRAARPTVVLVSRLVPHKRVDLLLHAVAAAVARVPDLQVHVVGGGPELATLRHTAVELGVGSAVTLHGRLPDARRNELLRSAWLTTSTSDGEGWGCAVLEAAAAGVPCLALRAPGIRDSVVEGRTGWLVDDPGRLGDALVRALTELTAAGHAERVAGECREWAARFDWDRSADLLAGVVLAEIDARRAPVRRTARSDMAVLARFAHPDPDAVARGLRRTDEVVAAPGGQVLALLHGCDEVGALTALHRIGVSDADVRLASRHEVLAGPALAAEQQDDRAAVAS